MVFLCAPPAWRFIRSRVHRVGEDQRPHEQPPHTDFPTSPPRVTIPNFLQGTSAWWPMCQRHLAALHRLLLPHPVVAPAVSEVDAARTHANAWMNIPKPFALVTGIKPFSLQNNAERLASPGLESSIWMRPTVKFASMAFSSRCGGGLAFSRRLIWAQMEDCEPRWSWRHAFVPAYWAGGGG